MLTLVSLAFPAILLFPRPWAARVAQLVLVLGGLEWIRTLVQLTVQRSRVGEPWLRMALILGAVALVTICSALVFRLRALRARYSL